MIECELRADSVGIDIGGRTLLDDANLVVRAGQLLAITGASGTGKTILAHVLAGLREPERGKVMLNREALRSIVDPANRPTLLSQDYGLVAALTAFENVALPLQVLGLAKNEIRERTSQWLHATGLESCGTRLTAELSGGQRQRVALARSFAQDAPALVMDEPTSELDAANRDLVLSLLKGKLEAGVAVVVVSHDDDLVGHADFVLELSSGRLAPRRTG